MRLVIVSTFAALAATATLTTVGALLGIAGGVAGLWSLWRVARLARDVERFLTLQAHDIEHARDDALPPKE